MDKAIDNKIRKYILEAAKENPGFVSAYLFGSYTRNNQRPESDIDIALVWEDIKDEDKFDLQVQLLLLANQFDERIEPHPFSKQDFFSNNPFVAEIRNHGIEIPLTK